MNWIFHYNIDHENFVLLADEQLFDCKRREFMIIEEKINEVRYLSVKMNNCGEEYKISPYIQDVLNRVDSSRFRNFRNESTTSTTGNGIRHYYWDTIKAVLDEANFWELPDTLNESDRSDAITVFAVIDGRSHKVSEARSGNSATIQDIRNRLIDLNPELKDGF